MSARKPRRCAGCKRQFQPRRFRPARQCERCRSNFMAPVADSREQHGLVTVYTEGPMRLLQEQHRVSNEHGPLTPEVWGRAAEADLDAIRIRHLFDGPFHVTLDGPSGDLARLRRDAVIEENKARLDATRQYPSLTHDSDATAASN